MTTTLGIDAGGTGTRWCLLDEKKNVLAAGTVEALSGHIYSEEAVQKTRSIIEAMVNDVGRMADPSRILAGVTGLSAGAAPALKMQHLLAEGFYLSAERVDVVDDLWLVYRAHFGLGEGIAVYAGTGSVAYHLDSAGKPVRIGGYGPLIDDAGSGFWIARKALRHVLRAEEEKEGEGWKLPLGKALAKRLPSTEWDDVRAYAYGGERGRIALLAPAVAEAAAQGDAFAISVLESAGAELARLARIMQNRLGKLPVVLTGGVIRLDPRISASFQAALPSDTVITVASADAALCAARLAGEAHKSL